MYVDKGVFPQPEWIHELYPSYTRIPHIAASDPQILRGHLDNFIKDCECVLNNPALGIQKQVAPKYVGRIDEHFVLFMAIHYREATGQEATISPRSKDPGAFFTLMTDVYTIAIDHMPLSAKKLEHHLAAVRRRLPNPKMPKN